MIFEVGDKAVYPLQGVGVIQAVEEKEILGKKQSFYILQILDTKSRIMIPRHNVNSVGLRPIITGEEIPKVFKILKSKTDYNDSQTWNKRYRDLTSKLKEGSIYSLAEVYRDLTLLKKIKELSFGEKRLLETARKLLIKELAIPLDKSEEETLTQLNDLINHP